MKRIFLILAAFAALLAPVSCNRLEAPAEAETISSGGRTETVKVTIEGGGGVTKVDISGTTGIAAWTSGDQIAYCVTNGSSTSYNVSTVDVASGEIFVTIQDGYWRANYAVYPASARGSVLTGNPTVVYPTDYDLAGRNAETYSPCPMVAVNSGSDLDFYHVGGLLRVHVSGIPSGTKTIEVSFPGVEHVTGVFSVSNAGGASASCSVVSGTGNVVSFTNGGADFGTATYLNVPVPSVSLAGMNGVAVRCKDSSSILLRAMRVSSSWSASVRAKGRTASLSAGNAVSVFGVADRKYVTFSSGNLQAHIAGGPDANGVYTADQWRFAENQWDCCGTSLAVGNWHDLFGWVGESATYDSYGLTSDTGTNNAWYGTGASESLKTPWGEIPGVVSAVGPGWRVLTKDEYVYLFDTRATGVTVNGTANARYTEAVVNGVNGVILFPDGYAGGTPAGVTWGTINAGSAWTTIVTAAGWASLEAAGCAFLPASNCRYGSGAPNVGPDGFYWSSTPNSVDNAFDVCFYSGGIQLNQRNDSRFFGFCVRLARDI